MTVVYANSVDPDQTPRSEASDLGLHCLPISHLWHTRHNWVNHLIVQSRPILTKFRHFFQFYMSLEDNLHMCANAMKPNV